MSETLQGTIIIASPEVRDLPPRSGPRYQPEGRRIAIAVQGGGSHAAFGAGALGRLLEEPGLAREIVALTGTSGGAHNAAIAWAWLHHGQPHQGARMLARFWRAMSATTAYDAWATQMLLWINASWVKVESSPYYGLAHNAAGGGQDRIRDCLRECLPDGDLPATPNRHAAPHLLLGTMEILSGEGRAIPGAEATVEHLLASAALPEMFPAHQPRLGNRWDGTYWDGLFFMNPPVAETFDLPDPYLPDEIWVIRINPKTRDHVPESWLEIADRRNELSGNLSLDQEVAQIRRINEMLACYPGTPPVSSTGRSYQQVAVRELWLDGSQINHSMDLASKLDRTPDFIEELMTHGRAQADAFLAELPVRVA